MPRIASSLVTILTICAVTPVLADPPPQAKAQGWRNKNDPAYVGYTGKAWSQDYGVIEGRCNTDVILGVAGAAVGGAVGSQAGNGSGRTAAILAGAALGAIVGASVGRQLDRADEACIGHALELAPQGQAVRWTRKGGAGYMLVPMKNVGADCREFKLETSQGSKKSWGTKVACRSGDGIWTLRS